MEYYVIHNIEHVPWFYIYLDHSKCTEKSCGPLGNCTAGGGCICNDGYEMPPDDPPTSTSYGCIGKKL